MHPAINFFRSGIPIVFGSDDPSLFGTNEFTVEFYEAFMGWGLTLADFKKISLDSIKYSVIDERSKEEGYRKFELKWSQFIDKIYSDTCTYRRFSNSQPKVTNVLPQMGPFNQTTTLTIYGNGFEAALCENIQCMFGDVSVPAKLDSIREISCKTPLGFKLNSLVDVKIKYGSTILETNKKFRFMTLDALNGPVAESRL